MRRLPWSGASSDPQRRQDPGHDTPVPRRLLGQGEIWEPADDRREGDRCLEPGQGRAEAVVRSPTEADVVSGVGTRDIERLRGAAPATRVAVRGGQREDE